MIGYLYKGSLPIRLFYCINLLFILLAETASALEKNKRCFFRYWILVQIM